MVQPAVPGGDNTPPPGEMMLPAPPAAVPPRSLNDSAASRHVDERLKSASELFRAAFHKIPALRANDLLVDRLFEAVEASLRHTELDLVDFLLPRHCLRRNLTRHPLAERQRHSNRGAGCYRTGGYGRRGGGLREGGWRESE
jgi:hypothetical protein